MLSIRRKERDIALEGLGKRNSAYSCMIKMMMI
jgi:hypothetical protein